MSIETFPGDPKFWIRTSPELAESFHEESSVFSGNLFLPTPQAPYVESAR
jgi:hypothetical protein